MNHKKMLAFNLGFTCEKAISGGDVLLMDLVRHLESDIEITVVIPQKGYGHWKRLGPVKNLRLKMLKPNFFDTREGAVAVFFTYLIRSFQALKFHSGFDLYYSCSDVFPDVLSPFLMRFWHPKVAWISRIYHIFLSPKHRRGSHLVNLVSTKLQKISWWMMRLKSQKILALNGKLAKDLENYGFKDLPVLGAGVDLGVIRECRPAKKSFDGIFLGRLSRTKGIYDLLEIWARVVQGLPDASLAIIGGGPEGVKKELGTRIEELGLKKNVAMLGFIESKVEIYSLLKSAKVFLFPSHEEGWGLVVAEAMACGLPVVGYDLDIFGAVFKSGFRTAPLFDKSAFAKQMIKILVNSDYKKNLSKEALEESAKLDNDEVAKEFIKYV